MNRTFLSLKTMKFKLETLVAAALAVSIFSWSALFAWQGLDFSDLGFFLSTYQQFYLAPENNIYGLHRWLTAFIGHWSGEILGGTVLAYNLAASLTLTFTGVISFLGLKIISGRSWELACCVFICFLFATKTNGNWISSNHLTGLFFTIGAITLFHGLHSKRINWILISGLVLGSNLFIRFPNLLGIILVTAIILQGFIQNWEWQRTLRWALLFLSGYFLGVFLIAALISFHGHSELYLLSLQGLLNLAANDESHHSGSMLFWLFLQDHTYAFLIASIIIGIGLICLYIVSNFPSWLQTLATILAAIILSLAFNVFESWKWAVPGLLYFGLIWIAFKEWHKKPQVTLLAFIGLVVLVVAPLGSSGGIRNAAFGQWIALPLLLLWLWRGGPHASLPLVQTAIARRLAATTLIITLISYSLISSWFYIYRDSPNRLALTHNINHPLLIGTRTTLERASVVQQLLDEMQNWVQQGDTLLAYPDLATVHFLTKTRSWLNNPWPILYQEVGIKNRLNEKLSISEDLPIVVRSLGTTRNRSWPNDIIRKESTDREAAWNTLDRFVKEQGYTVVWSNEFFELLAPPESALR